MHGHLLCTLSIWLTTIFFLFSFQNLTKDTLAQFIVYVIALMEKYTAQDLKMELLDYG